MFNLKSPQDKSLIMPFTVKLKLQMKNLIDACGGNVCIIYQGH